ncbi:hypothetical protein ACFFJN_15985 [Erwinia mallotivora]|uniref:hypothetical protein n=1 Tax=Erwinia mallotivora TaxID=69222 RepID=UPI0035ED7219
MDTAWRQGTGGDVSVTTLATLAGRDMNVRVTGYDRPGFNDHRRDRGVSFGVSFSLAPAARHIISAETGMNQNQGYSSLNYQWQPASDSGIRTLGGGVSYSPQNTVISGNAAVDTPYVSGDGYVQHNTQGRSNTAGGNLSQMLVLGGGKVASVNGSNSRNMESALIVDVDSDDDSTGIVASGSMAETRLKAGRNIVPAELWKKDTVQFSASGGGSVKYIKVKAVKTFTVVGMLQDGEGKVLKNRYVSSDVSGGVINPEGVLTLDSGVANRTLIVRAENGQPAMQCELPTGLDNNKKVQFINEVPCRPTSTAERQ